VEVIEFADPSTKASGKVGKALLKDLSGAPLASEYYQQLIEQVCDDLLEDADKKIDAIK
jgi:hypothetical protein